ncbi:heterocyst differentiation protein HetZ [Planktothrix sp. FACHB-1355]|uniref:Heterocyst differentiation protein HetZ n=1 Tax=Aerosakkonema funiforme FACHB-1375 TaxID=2949571 RepID=A0A926ZJG3_9CYAN|nr:heterocyst differentiation protein HetZ [Aerosakkonema funiforme FACHB-1375]MBD3560236.1 heterocyst differentiation protein HetZ [Planktothrix sp. FACHB-1355]
MEAIFELLFAELKQSTRASEQNCREVAARIATEVTRICNESKRIQALGAVETWATKLARHRLQQCLNYYKLGSTAGRVELHSTLSAIVYRYITPPGASSIYENRLTLIEDFLQGFYVEALSAFRREGAMCQLAPTSPTYRPETLLELAEFLAFTERYAKRRIRLSHNRTQQLVILRAQAFVQKQPPETSVDMEQAAEGGTSESEASWDEALVQQVRQVMGAQEDAPNQEDSLRQSVIDELMAYLQERQQEDCADYFALRLQDLNTQEIEAIMGLTQRQRDYLQQRFKYHLIRFALLHRWELVHEWLEADIERNLGLVPQQWQTFLASLEPEQLSLLELKQKKLSDREISRNLGWTVTQIQKQWFKLLEKAWDLRNSFVSGSGASTDEQRHRSLP